MVQLCDEDPRVPKMDGRGRGKRTLLGLAISRLRDQTHPRKEEAQDHP